jgi:hypothetical protein
MGMTLRRALLGLFLSALILTTVGCGKRLAKVEGVVTLDGKPLAGATVSFVPAGEGRAATGRTGTDGSFRLTTFRTDDGALPGEYRVVVTVTEMDERLSKDPKTWSDQERKAARMTMTPTGKRQAAEKKRKTPPAVPPIYSDPKLTPLKEVVPPDGKVDIALHSGSV